MQKQQEPPSYNQLPNQRDDARVVRGGDLESQQRSAIMEQAMLLQRQAEEALAVSRYLLPGFNDTLSGGGGGGGGELEPDSYDDADSSLDESFIEAVVRIVVPISFGIIGVLGLIGNTLVVAVVAFNTNMRSTTNILIINLAVADLLFVIFCIPFTATDFVLPYWPFGDVWCKCVQYFIIVTACASVYTLVLMSFDRYLAVVHPVSSRSLRTENNAMVAIFIVWILILTLAIPVFMIHGEVPDGQTYEESLNGSIVALNLSEHRYLLRLTANDTLSSMEELDNVSILSPQQQHTTCRILNDREWAIFQWSFFLVSYMVPLLLIGGLYLCMLMRLWQAPRISADGLRGRKRVTRLVAVVVGVFAFSWAPIQIILLLKSLDVYPHNTWSIMFQIAAHVLAYANSCINPILYAFLSENFRKAFRKAVYCRSTRNQDQQNHLQTRTTRIPSTDQLTRLLRRGKKYQPPKPV